MNAVLQSRAAGMHPDEWQARVRGVGTRARMPAAYLS